jgi:Ser/Thr protein kinase RdoA (MazF antagonist)
MPEVSATREEFRALPLGEQAERLTELATAALERFELAPDSGLALLKHRENTVFRIDEAASGARWVLRVHRADYQTRESIRSELLWMDALRETRLNTPCALAGRDGERVQTVSVPGVPEPRHCSVLSWLEGEPLDAAHSSEAYGLLGELHARLHLHSRRWSPPPGFTRQRWDEAGMLGEAPLWGRFQELGALASDQRGLLEQARSRVLERLAHFGKAGDRFGLIHADFMPDNVLIHDGRASVIDFDDCGFGWHLYDPATLFSFVVSDDAFPGLLDAWTGGYRSVAPLPDEHLAELPTFLMARGLVLARLITDGFVELACDYAESLLGG